MRVRSLRPHLPVAMAVLLVLLLAVLAALQWRWIGEVSDLERHRLRASLAAAGGRFAEDFDREVAQVFMAFHPDLGSAPGDRLARVVRQYESWRNESPHPELVRDVFLVRRGEDGRPRLAVLRPETRAFEPCGWPAELAPLRHHLEAAAPMPSFRRVPRGMGVSLFGEMPGLLIPLAFSEEPEAGEPAGGLEGAHLLVRLDRRTISGTLLPALTRRYFDDARGGDYAVAVLDRSQPGRPVYVSDPRVAPAWFRDADLRLDMLRLRPFEDLHSPWPRHGPGEHHWRPPLEPRLRTAMPALPGTPAWREGGAWELVVKRREGSLEAVVAHVRFHNLGISLGILALLATTMGLLMVTTQRAQRLARQQIEFVAGVTHELNTPLTAIRSAGQNLADGVVAEPGQVRRYGTLIANEGRRLSDMVGQALEFAGIQSGRRSYPLRPVETAEIVDGALQDSRWLLQEKGVAVEREVAAGLPAVQADAAALRRAVQNLIENAVKYGAEAGWVGVRARRAFSGGVEITVADRGPGIRAEDLPHLFEPFFRGRHAGEGGVPGSGLGLSLVRHIVEAHGGRVTVETGERGSVFTLHLPAAAEAAEMQAVEEPA